MQIWFWCHNFFIEEPNNVIVDILTGITGTGFKFSLKIGQNCSKHTIMLKCLIKII